MHIPPIQRPDLATTISHSRRRQCSILPRRPSRPASLPSPRSAVRPRRWPVSARAGVNPLANAPTMPKDVTDTVIGAVDLGKEINVDGRQLRTRRLVVQPGGIVPIHSHADRPALIVVVSGSITEHRSDLRDAGRAPRRRHQPRGRRHLALLDQPRQRARGAAVVGRIPRQVIVPRAGRSTPSWPATPGVPPCPRRDANPFQASSCPPHRSKPSRQPMPGLSPGALAADRRDRLPDPGRPVRHPGDPAQPRRRIWRAAVRDRRRRQFDHARHGDRRPAGRRCQRAISSASARSRLSLLLLAVPTALLAFAPNLTIFALLRITQGLFMAAAFTLTLTHLAERCERRTATALAAYVTGVVASNLIGRLTAAFVAGLVGATSSFLFFAALNVAGAALAAVALHRERARRRGRRGPLLVGLGCVIWPIPRCAATFAIGFLILFGFIGVFTYVGFVLMSPPHALSMGALGLVFLVFAPSMVTTPLAGRVTERFGPGVTVPASLALALAGLALMLAAEPVAGHRRHDAGRDRHLLRPGGRDRPCRPHRRGRQGRRQRALSVLLLLRRPRRRGGRRPAVRPLRLERRGRPACSPPSAWRRCSASSFDTKEN